MTVYEKWKNVAEKNHAKRMKALWAFTIFINLRLMHCPHLFWSQGPILASIVLIFRRTRVTTKWDARFSQPSNSQRASREWTDLEWKKEDNEVYQASSCLPHIPAPILPRGINLPEIARLLWWKKRGAEWSVSPGGSAVCGKLMRDAMKWRDDRLVDDFLITWLHVG